MQPPIVNLQPGAQGPQVKQLQDYLVSIGLLTPAQVATGPGIYGPATTAAVSQLQQRLGVDNSTGIGFWGPRTIAAVQQTAIKTPSATSAPSSTGNPQLDQLLSNPTLTPDQKAMAQKTYDLISTNDMAQANKLTSAFQAATQYSDPYFKAQIGLVNDQLARNLQAKEGDLAFHESQLHNSLTDLQNNLAASKDQLSFQHAQELQNLAKSYKQDLSNTRQDMASRGFSSSSVRSHAEDLLNQQNQGLVESSNRKFAFQNNGYDAQLSQGNRDYALQLKQLRDTVAAGKLDLLRSAESKVGSSNLKAAGYSNLLGNVGGDIPRQAATNSLGFASNFVF